MCGSALMTRHNTVSCYIFKPLENNGEYQLFLKCHSFQRVHCNLSSILQTIENFPKYQARH